MKHPGKIFDSVMRAALCLGLGLGALGFARSASAYPTYPAALAAAIATAYPGSPSAKCVPLCTACHLTTQGGGPTNKFGSSLILASRKVMGADGKGSTIEVESPSVVGPALTILAMTDPDSDGDGTHDVEEIKAGDSPSLASPDGIGQFCPDIEYGCGARIAAAPPADRFGLFSAGLVVLGFAVARRRRRSALSAPSAQG